MIVENRGTGLFIRIETKNPLQRSSTLTIVYQFVFWLSKMLGDQLQKDIYKIVDSEDEIGFYIPLVITNVESLQDRDHNASFDMINGCKKLIQGTRKFSIVFVESRHVTLGDQRNFHHIRDKLTGDGEHTHCTVTEVTGTTRPHCRVQVICCILCLYYIF